MRFLSGALCQCAFSDYHLWCSSFGTSGKGNSVPWYDEEGDDSEISYRENENRSQERYRQRNVGLSGCVSSYGVCIVISKLKTNHFSMNLRQRGF